MIVQRIQAAKRFFASFFYMLIVFLFMAMPGLAASENNSGGALTTGIGKTVRVGWHVVPHFITDKNGRRSGYSYDYLCKLAAYTGWTYEYVHGNWPQLLQKLKDGEIDLLSDVSFLEERTKDMLYPSYPMGTEAYYIFIAPGNKDITMNDFSSLNGKRVGVTKNSFQKQLLLRWMKRHNVDAELIELSNTEQESLLLLGKQLDAFVTMDIYGNPQTAIPICKIGSSDFYFAVKKDRLDLLAELDAAMNRIQDENKYFNQQLHDKYLLSANTERYLNSGEKEWLAKHGTIRVGYQDNYLAFCARDGETGELTGALKDFLDSASAALENVRVDFKPVAYPTAAAAMDALKKGEIDCVFPANLAEYDSETLGVVMTPALMRTEMDAVVRASEKKEFVRKKWITVAVNKGNTNYDRFLAEHYPDWHRAYFTDTPAGLEAVANGRADCVIISNYRYNNISKQCEKLHLTTVYTGVDMDYCFAVRKGDIELYSVLARLINTVPDATVHKALTYYSTEDVKTSFLDLIKENLVIVTSLISLVLLVIVLLLLRNLRAEKKIIEEEHLVHDLNRKVFIDALTSVRNKGAFTNYVKDLQKRLDQGEKMDFAIGVFDCDNLKMVNDQNGHDKGDIYIKTASRLICRVFQHSPVFRIGGDEFAVVLQNEDFQNRDDLIGQFDSEKRKAIVASGKKWEQPRVAIGIAVYDAELDGSVDDTIRRADKIMYENKRVGKLE